MSELPSQHPDASGFNEEIAIKNQKKWKNRFLLSLTISIFLVGMFWLPLKAIEVNDFFNSPSVNLPQTGDVAEKKEEKAKPVTIRLPKNVLLPKYSTHKSFKYNVSRSLSFLISHGW